MLREVDQRGFAIARGVTDAEARQDLIAELGPVSGAGRRGLLAHPVVARLANSDCILDLVRPLLPTAPIPVRAIFFDKSPDANWLVSWHQDVTLALRARADVPGFGPWSIKDGVPHVQAPPELLAQMLAVRLHLDDADESNGALRVIPGSHSLGRLSANEIQKLRTERPEFLCTAAAGDALLMRPLLLHASSRSTSTKHRRILHIEYAGFSLPAELNWHEAA